jgi:hypothetical protein
MIEPPFRAALVALVGLSPLAEPGGLAASQAAIALATITVAAQPEHGLAVRAEANSLAEKYFVVVVHLPARAGLDTARRFVAVWNLFDVVSAQAIGRAIAGNPSVCRRRGSTSRLPRHDISIVMDDERAYGADDVAAFGVMFRKLRFLMIADSAVGTICATDAD